MELERMSLTDMAHYIAVIHKERASAYGISFPDVPGVIASAASLDEAISEAAQALAFAAEDWDSLTGETFPAPRTLDDPRSDSELQALASDAVIAAIPLQISVGEAA